MREKMLVASMDIDNRLVGLFIQFRKDAKRNGLKKAEIDELIYEALCNHTMWMAQKRKGKKLNAKTTTPKTTDEVTA